MTHVDIDVDNINWDQFILTQEGGQQLNKYFIGQKYMRGYGILSNIGKLLLPIAKNFATSIGSEGVEAGSRILKDVTEGKDFSEALKEHSKKGLENLSEKIKQCGKGERGTSAQKGNGKNKRKKEKNLKNNNNYAFTAYPPRPLSPSTLRSLTAQKELYNKKHQQRQHLQKKQRQRKPDQLDFLKNYISACCLRKELLTTNRYLGWKIH